MTELGLYIGYRGFCIEIYRLCCRLIQQQAIYTSQPFAEMDKNVSEAYMHKFIYIPSVSNKAIRFLQNKAIVQAACNTARQQLRSRNEEILF